MSSLYDFDELEGDSQVARPKQAFWTLNLEDKEAEKSVLNWLNGELNFLKDKSTERLNTIKKNRCLYRGIQYQSQEVRRDLSDRSVDKSRTLPKIVVNHMLDITHFRVGRLVKYRPAVSIIPADDEFKDKVAAKATKELLDHIWYVQDFQGNVTKDLAMMSSIDGECYLGVFWNPSIGDLHPESPKDGESITLKDDNGEPMKDDAGNVIKVTKPVRIGDVEYKIIHADKIFLEKRRQMKDVNYCFIKETISYEDLKVRYPKTASKVKKQENSHHSEDDDTVDHVINPVDVYHFYHKRTEALDKGRYIVFTMDALLENVESPYSHGELPVERITDIDLPGELHAMSFFETVKGIFSAYNNLTNMILRNQHLVSHPKWMFQAGTVKIESLGNDITLVQYKGPNAPQLVQMNPTPSEVFNFREKLKEDGQQISGVFGVSRGEPPSGIKAGVALQFLDEQEAERANLSVLKWNEFIRRIALKTISVANDYYDASDERMIRIFGVNDSWQTKFFDQSNLSKDYDVLVQKSSALPESKSGKVEYIKQLNEIFPGLVSGDQAMELLDLGQAEKFVSIVTNSLRAAEAENELIISGDKALEPEEYEDHIAHWKTHVNRLQSYQFKNETPKSVKEKLKDHVLAHEMFMDEKAQINPAFAEKLQALDLYPLFYTPQPAQEALPMDGVQAQPQGAPMEGPLPAAQELPNNPELAGEPTEPEPPPVGEQGPITEPGPITQGSV